MNDKLGPVLFIAAGIFLAFWALSGKAAQVLGAKPAAPAGGTSNGGPKANAPFANPADAYNGSALTPPFAQPSDTTGSIAGGAFGNPLTVKGLNPNGQPSTVPQTPGILTPGFSGNGLGAGGIPTYIPAPISINAFNAQNPAGIGMHGFSGQLNNNVYVDPNTYLVPTSIDGGSIDIASVPAATINGPDVSSLTLNDTFAPQWPPG